MNKLVEAVREKQARDKISDMKLSRMLGINQSTWSRIKSGGRKPGIKVVKALAKQFPEFAGVILNQLLD